MNERLKFPEGFLWGSATSSYQVEGGIDNNDWAEAARSSCVLVPRNGHLCRPAKMPIAKIPAAGRACDHYNRYEEDFDIAKSLGQNAHRFSIEWARVEPEEGRFDEGAIEHYRKVLQALRDRGLEPFVTLWHFTLPIWFAKMGGFENKKSPLYFARYCEYVVSKLGNRPQDAHPKDGHLGGDGGVRFWITINEPMIYAGQGYSRGIWPPFKRNFIKVWRVVDNLITSHNTAYQKIKAILPTSQIGIAADQVDYHYNYNPLSFLQSKFMNWFRNRRFLSRISRYQDFIGVNYYRPIIYYGKLDFEKTDMGWEIYPKGLYNVLTGLKCYHKPIYITENGIADAADSKRANFIRDHLRWVWQAIYPHTKRVQAAEPQNLSSTRSGVGVNDGVDVRGYFYWSLLDNFEWAHGFGPRFGLVEMNYDTMERKIRPSAFEYKKICESNSLILNSRF